MSNHQQLHRWHSPTAEMLRALSVWYSLLVLLLQSELLLSYALFSWWGGTGGQIFGPPNSLNATWFQWHKCVSVIRCFQLLLFLVGGFTTNHVKLR